MVTIERKKLEQVLDDLICASSYCNTYDAIDVVKEALAQDEQSSSQEPVKYEFQSTHDGKWYAFHDDKHYADDLADGRWPIRALYTTPPKQEPRNFCPRCGKRTADLTVIHTCTPPEGGHQ